MLSGAPSFLPAPGAGLARLLVGCATHAGRTGMASLALVLVACGSDTPGTPGEREVTARDSAGVTIVENRAPELSGSDAWRLSEQPTLQIGSLDDPDEIFARVTAARTLSDGRIATLDTRAHQVKVFGPHGALLTTFGREGEGPREFNFSWGADFDVLRGDTLLVFDGGLRRISLFESGGSFITVIRPQPPEPSGGFSYFARFDNGSYMTRGGTNPMYLGEGDGLIRGAGWISRLGPDGESMGNILEYRTGETVVAGGGRASIGTRLGRRHIAVPGREGPVVGFADGFHFEMYDWEGRLLRIVRRVWDPIAVADAEVDSFMVTVDRTVDRMRQMGADVTMRKIDFPEVHSAFDEAMVDPAGNVWIRTFRPRTSLSRGDEEGRSQEGEEGQQEEGEVPRRWSVFDPEGRWTTDVLVPADLQIMEIGEAHVLAVWADELGVQYLRRYELIRG
ncbi:MAG: hypothetical protein WD960_04090 [Gemmatimonadota bacterium]